MIRAPFELHTPRSIDEAVHVLADCRRRGEDAKLLAGGQSLLPALNLGLAAPAHVVSLNHVAGLDDVRLDPDEETLVLGACATHAKLAASELLQTRCPILAEAAAGIGDVQVRNRGTLGGSLGHCDPAADYPAVLLLLDAEMCLTGPTGERRVAVQDFFVDYMTTSLAEDEVLTEVRLPVPAAGSGMAYRKFTRVEGGFAIVGAAACVSLAADGTLRSVRVCLCGGAAIPLRVGAVEDGMQGRPPDDAWLDEIADAAYAAAHDPVAELHAAADYKREMLRVFTRRAVAAALERAG